MSDSTRVGKRRKRNRTGDLVGPYEVTGPVGDNWETSLYWRLKCPRCGYERTIHTEQISATSAKAKCGGCRQGRETHERDSAA